MQRGALANQRQALPGCSALGDVITAVHQRALPPNLLSYGWLSQFKLPSYPVERTEANATCCPLRSLLLRVPAPA